MAIGTGIAADAVGFTPPTTPPPRWVELAAGGTQLADVAGSGVGLVELVGAGAGLVEGAGGV